jgi:hypothetical protein
VKKLAISLAVLFVLCLSSAAKADTLTFTPNPVDLNDLDHHDVYTWRIDNVNLAGKQITGARLTLKNIANWDNTTNKLFIHLLDTARNAGVASFQDEPANAVPVNHIDDDFVDTRYHSNANWLVAPGTADTHLVDYTNLPTTAQTLVYNFTADQVNALIAYISNGGNFALGFDPDCHFFNDGITLQIFTAPNQTTPEPATLALLGTGLAGLYARKRRQQKRAI